MRIQLIKAPRFLGERWFETPIVLVDVHVLREVPRRTNRFQFQFVREHHLIGLRDHWFPEDLFLLLEQIVVDMFGNIGHFGSRTTALIILLLSGSIMLQAYIGDRISMLKLLKPSSLKFLSFINT